MYPDAGVAFYDIRHFRHLERGDEKMGNDKKEKDEKKGNDTKEKAEQIFEIDSRDGDVVFKKKLRTLNWSPPDEDFDLVWFLKKYGQYVGVSASGKLTFQKEKRSFTVARDDFQKDLEACAHFYAKPYLTRYQPLFLGTFAL